VSADEKINPTLLGFLLIVTVAALVVLTTLFFVNGMHYLDRYFLAALAINMPLRWFVRDAQGKEANRMRMQIVALEVRAGIHK
jgi:uncharacterized membrane protein